ncbi:transposase, partial [Thomasclavelia sp.]|uniref:transposase n=1 Tax=Thomasclavelia sp. TaxID=3025757 RepID=UPI0025F92EBC
GVNLRKYFKNRDRRGRKGYDSAKMLRALLFSMMVNHTIDYRKVATSCRYDVRFMHIMEYDMPSHNAFKNLVRFKLIKSIDEIFMEISHHIGELMNVDFSVQYIDGTKIEANANKNTFVYKKRIINAREKKFEKITQSVREISEEIGWDIPIRRHYCAQEMGNMAERLMEEMVSRGIEPVYGRGKRKSTVQRYYDTFLGYYQKLAEYEKWLDIIGEGRSSCSKTDHDATMCATKMDYYNNTGVTRACYNAQIAVSGGIVVNAELYQRPADQKTFIPLMERYKKYMGEYPKYPVADAGYGSYDNYMYCVTKKMELFMKYSMYAKKNEPKFKKKKFETLNWETDSRGYKICPEGHVFDSPVGEQYDEEGAYLKIKQKYTSIKKCEGCKNIDKCCKNGSKQRILTKDAVLNEFYEKVDKNLSNEFGKEQKKQRSIQVEGTFGVIKQDMGFTRLKRRGLENTRMEFLIVCLGYNLKKYHKYRMEKIKNRAN